LWWRKNKNKNKEACIVLYNSFHNIKVQKDYFEDPARKIHVLRGSRYLRLRGLSLTLNQVPQALLSI
jgi:hypothetical protein